MNFLQILTKLTTKLAAAGMWAWLKPERIMLMGGAMLVWLGITIMYWPAGMVVLGLVLVYLAREVAE